MVEVLQVKVKPYITKGRAWTCGFCYCRGEPGHLTSLGWVGGDITLKKYFCQTIMIKNLQYQTIEYEIVHYFTI